MSKLKKVIYHVTGYWFHKARFLPPGTSLYHDLSYRFGLFGPSVIFDVGANIGQTLKAFRSLYPKANIHSFEPVAETFGFLQKNASRLPGRNLLVHAALGGAEGKVEARLFDGPAGINSLKPEAMNPAQRARREAITVHTLDEYCVRTDIRRIDLLKIDTEGYEEEVIRGGRGMLSEGRVSFILVEAGFANEDERHTPFHTLKSLLESLGFSFYAMYEMSHASFIAGDHYGNALFVHHGALHVNRAANMIDSLNGAYPA